MTRLPWPAVGVALWLLEGLLGLLIAPIWRTSERQER